MKLFLPLLAACAALQALPAAATSFEFVPAPQTDLNRMYRVDKVTGEVTSCQYGLQESAGGIGQTVCFGSGEGAGPQTPSEYGLVASRHTREAGVFRVNYRTGEMSICFVLVKKEQVVCTQQGKPGAEGASDTPLTGPAPGRAGASATPTQGGRP
ncbi:hypothetical protein ASG32_07685 [Methylobacterium sp. Leaf361]|uniref:hypothetical protein n=1 Tax=Methylobacterium sp. Leaf361 TaxID=1736352 RepID=UPI0006F68645|nr:hypothetical protein [Methylobacterium sp. Leaf361]KQS74973.1 hypothetical protein ASG32_07685 [Methylobacterium sp. Leaf361]